jgi:hypothetical protein
MIQASINCPGNEIYHMNMNAPTEGSSNNKTIIPNTHHSTSTVYNNSFEYTGITLY